MRFDVTAVFHGHAHKGSPEGATSNGIPVYNVALQVLRSSYPDRPPFRIFEVATGPTTDSGVRPIVDRRHGGRRASDRVENPPTG